MKDSRLGFLTLLTTLVLLTVEASFGATGGSFYASQLSSIGAGNTSYGNTNGSTANYSIFNPLTEALDLQAGQWPNSMAMVYNTAADQPSFMEWDLPSGTFNAKTVLAYRNTTYPSFSSGSPWHLELFDGSTWKPIAVGGAGANADGTLAMGNTDITGTKIRAIYDHLNFAGNYFMSMGELVVLPDELHPVANSYTATASSFYLGNPAYAPSKGIDNQLGGANSWFSTPGDSNAWYTLSFSGPSRIDSLMLSKWDNAGGYTDAIVDIYVNGTLAGGWTNGTKVAGNVDMSSPLNFGSFNVFKFDSPLTGVNDLTLKFLNGGRSTDGGQGLGEIIPLFIPEPSAVMLLGVGGALLLRRHKARV